LEKNGLVLFESKKRKDLKWSGEFHQKYLKCPYDAVGRNKEAAILFVSPHGYAGCALMALGHVLDKRFSLSRVPHPIKNSPLFSSDHLLCSHSFPGLYFSHRAPEIPSKNLCLNNQNSAWTDECLTSVFKLRQITGTVYK